MLCHRIRRIDSPPSRKSPQVPADLTPTARDIRSWLRLMFTAMDDPIIQHIARFRCKSVGALCRLPCASLQRADGASTVRNCNPSSGIPTATRPKPG
jgi:hypothetical protein